MLATNMSNAQVEEEIRHLGNIRLKLERYGEVEDEICKVVRFDASDLDSM